MNKERILALADLIEQEPHRPEHQAQAGFGMAQYRHSCGTPSCIAGYAAHLAKGDKELDWLLYEATNIVANEYLGIGYSVGAKLYNPSLAINWDEITPKQAAKCLRTLARFGFVDWNHAVEEKANA